MGHVANMVSSPWSLMYSTFEFLIFNVWLDPPLWIVSLGTVQPSYSAYSMNLSCSASRRPNLQRRHTQLLQLEALGVKPSKEQSWTRTLRAVPKNGWFSLLAVVRFLIVTS